MNPIPGLTEGLLLVGLAGSVSFPLVLPAGGLLDLKISLPKGVFLQSVEFDLTTLMGTFSNVLR